MGSNLQNYTLFFSQFRQTPCLAKFFEWNTQQRGKSKNKYKFSQIFDQFILFKIIEEIRKPINLDLTNKTDTKKLLKYRKKTFFGKIGEHENITLNSFNKQ